MDDDPGYKYIEKFREGVQWYMMESKDFISTIIFELKLKWNFSIFQWTVNNLQTIYQSS